MIRYALLWMAVAFVMAYAWKDWVRALCILLIMLAVFERPDIPKGMLGISGLNPFNLALAGILAAWAVDTLRNPRRWDQPWHVTLLLAAYFAIMLIGFGRMITDAGALTNTDLPDTLRRSKNELWIEFLINTIKWTIPGLLLLHGCRDRRQMRTAVFCLLWLLLLLAVQVIRQMPLEYALDGQALQERALRVLDRAIGYHRVDLAMVLAGAPWAFLAARGLTTSPLANIGLIALAGVSFVGLALTGGRTGYVSWGAAGAVLCALRWRGYLMLAPVVALAVLLVLPGTIDRFLEGVDVEALTNSPASPTAALLRGEALDARAVTSGRTEVWPYVLRKIKEQPFTGYGRRAHERTGLWIVVYLEQNELFGHPHNAFLEFALDNGLIALALVLGFFGVVVYKASGLFRDRDPLATGIGGLTIGLVVSFLAACMGAQTLYPTGTTVAMWCAMCLTLRLWQDRRALETATAPALGEERAVGPSMEPPLQARPGAAALWPNAIRKRRPVDPVRPGSRI